MKPEELRVGDYVNMPWYGKMVVGRVSLVATDRVHVIPFAPGNHPRRETVFKMANSLEPVTLTNETLAGWGFRFMNEAKESIVLHVDGPVSIWLEWREDNKCFFVGDTLLPEPICNVHQVQHLIADFGLSIETNNIVL